MEEGGNGNHWQHGGGVAWHIHVKGIIGVATLTSSTIYPLFADPILRKYPIVNQSPNANILFEKTIWWHHGILFPLFSTFTDWKHDEIQ